VPLIIIDTTIHVGVFVNMEPGRTQKRHLKRVPLPPAPAQSSSQLRSYVAGPTLDERLQSATRGYPSTRRE
jgi:hypothetical protein